MRTSLPTLFFLGTLLLGCGGSGSSGGGGGAAPPPTAQSAGGVWFATTPPVSTLTLLIAETGEMRVTAAGPSFGAGAVIVTNNNQVSGSYQTRSLQPSPTTPAGPDLDCTVQGTVTTRTSMQLTVRCTDTTGSTTEQNLSFAYDTSHGTDSSLAAIAGNYTLEFRPATNTLNINGDGTLFGMLDNGPQCLLNGRVEIIDPDFDLYRLTVSFANCSRLLQYEGITMTGFARRGTPVPAGAFYALLTGVVDGRLQAFSLLYVPA
jgi:hypothetical protein